MKDQRLQLLWGSGYAPCVMFHGTYYVLTTDSENTTNPVRVVDPMTAIHTYMFRTADYSVIAETAVAKALKLLCSVMREHRATKRSDILAVLQELLRGYMDIEAGDMFVGIDGSDTLGILVFAGNGEQLYINADAVTHRQKTRGGYCNLSALPSEAQDDVLFLLGFQFPTVDNDRRRLKDAYSSHKHVTQTMLDDEVLPAQGNTSSVRTAALVILHRALNRVRTADATANPIDGKAIDFQAICNKATRSQIINQVATDIAMELNVILTAKAKTC